MQTYEFITYGGYAQIVQSFTTMSLIFANNNYNALWFTIIALGFGIPGISYYLKGLAAGGQAAGMSALTTWMIPAVLSIVVWMALIRHDGALQITDLSIGQSQQVTMPLGVAMLAGTLNKIENGLVDIISSAGDVNSPNDYRKFSGGAGYDMLAKRVTHKNAVQEQTLQSYYTECFLPNASLYGGNLDLNDYKFGTPSGVGFWAILGQAALPNESGTDYTQQPAQSMTCDQLWNTVVFPHYGDPNNFTDDIDTLCKQSGYDTTDAMSSALCREKMQDILTVDGGKAMSPEDYMAMKEVAEMSMANLNDGDPNRVAETVADKTLQSQGLGIGVVVSKYGPKIRAMMWCLTVGLIPILSLFIPTPFCKKALSVIVGLMVWLVSWTVSDCLIHTIMHQYVADNFAPLRDLGKGVLFYMNVPTEASEAVSLFGYAKGLSIMLATVITTVFELAGGYAMAQLAGGMQGNLQQAGQQAGHTAYTPEGRAQAIDQQHRVGESMTNAHRFQPSQMFEKGRIGAENSFGGAMAIKQGQQEAINKGLLAPGSSIADYAQNTGFRNAQNQIGAFQSQEDGLKSAKKQGLIAQDANVTDLARLGGDAKQNFVGKDGKVYSAAVGQNGEMFWSDAKSGHSEAIASKDIKGSTKTFAKGSAGGFDMKFEESLTNSANTAIDTASSKVKTAQDNKGVTENAVRTESASLAKNVSTSDSFSTAEKKNFSDSYSKAFTVSENDTNKLSKMANISQKDAQTILKATQAEVGVNTPKLLDAIAPVSAGLKNSGTIQDTAGLDRAMTVIRGGEFNHIENDAKDWRSAVSAVKDIAHSKNDSVVSTGATSVNAAYSNNQTASKNVSDARTELQDVKTAASTVQSKGVRTHEDGFKMLQNQLIADNGGGEKGMAAADKIMHDYNNGNDGERFAARTQIFAAKEKIENSFGSDIKAEAARIKSAREGMQTEVAADIRQAEKQVPRSPNEVKADYVAEKNAIAKQRAASNVAGNKVIQQVAPTVTVTDRARVNAKIPEHVSPHKQEITQDFKTMNTKLDTMQNILPGNNDLLASTVALGITPKFAIKEKELAGTVSGAVVDAGVNVAVKGAEVVSDAVTHPLGTFKTIAAEAMPIAFDGSREAAAERVRSTVMHLEEPKK